MNKIITIDKELKKELSLLAIEREMSLKKYIETILKEHVENKKDT